MPTVNQCARTFDRTLPLFACNEKVKHLKSGANAFISRMCGVRSCHCVCCSCFIADGNNKTTEQSVPSWWKKDRGRRVNVYLRAMFKIGNKLIENEEWETDRNNTSFWNALRSSLDVNVSSCELIELLNSFIFRSSLSLFLSLLTFYLKTCAPRGLSRMPKAASSKFRRIQENVSLKGSLNARSKNAVSRKPIAQQADLLSFPRAVDLRKSFLN